MFFFCFSDVVSINMKQVLISLYLCTFSHTCGTLGWDKDAAKFLKTIARQDARRWGKEGSVEIKHFFQRLSVALQRGNAALLIDRDIEPHV